MTHKLPTGVTRKGKKFLVSVCYRRKRLSVSIDDLSLANVTRANLNLAMEKAHGDPKVAREMYDNEDVYRDVSYQDLHQHAPMSLRKKEWTLGEAHDALIAFWDREGCSESNKYKARIVLRYFGSKTRLSQIDTEAIEKYMDYAKSLGHANATIRKNVSALARMMSLAVERGRLLVIPRFKRPKLKENPVRWIGQHDPKEAEKIENLFLNWGMKDHYDAFVCLMDLGVRQCELFHMKEGNISFDFVDTATGSKFPVVTFWKTKNTHPRTIPMSTRVCEVIKGRMTGDPDKWLFPYDNHWFKTQWIRVRQRLGKMEDKGFTPHICRHTAASKLVQSGVPIKVVQEFLGHRDIKMTLRYAHLAPTNLIAAVDVINKVNGNGNADTAYSSDTKKYREGDKAEINKLVNTEVKNIIEQGDPIVHNDTTVRPEDERRLP